MQEIKNRDELIAVLQDVVDQAREALYSCDDDVIALLVDQGNRVFFDPATGEIRIVAPDGDTCSMPLGGVRQMRN